MPEVVEPNTRQQLNELSIHIHIAGRSYPLSVAANEEANLRAAGKLIQEKVQLYKEQFSLRDHQDALAMFALEVANENLKLKKQVEAGMAETDKELDQIDHLLRHIQL